MMRLGDFLSLSLFLTVVAWSILWSSPLLLPADTTWTLFGAKLTFFSVIFAVGWWQYGYFYQDFVRFFREFAPAWDGWIALKKSTDERDDLVVRSEQRGERADLIDPVREQVQRDRQQLQGTEVNRQHVLSMVEQDLKQYQVTLSLLFGVGVTLLVSLFADLIGNIVAPHRAWAALSYGAFLVALAQFVILTILYIMIVSRQLDMLREGAEKYRGIRFH